MMRCVLLAAVIGAAGIGYGQDAVPAVTDAAGIRAIIAEELAKRDLRLVPPAIDPAAPAIAPATESTEPPITPYPEAGVTGLAFNLARLDDIWSGATKRPHGIKKAVGETALKTLVYGGLGYGAYVLYDEATDSGGGKGASGPVVTDTRGGVGAQITGDGNTVIINQYADGNRNQSDDNM